MKRLAALLMLLLCFAPPEVSAASVPKSEFEKAELAIEKGEHAAARMILTALAESGYRRADTLYLLGIAELSAGELKEAMTAFENALVEEKKRRKIYAIRKKIGEVYLAMSEYGKAITLFEDLYEERRSDTDVLYALAVINHAIGTDRDAIGYLKEALSRRKKHLPAQILLAEIYALQGKSSEVEKIYRDVLAADPDAAKEMELILFRIRLHGDAGFRPGELSSFLKDRPASMALAAAREYMTRGRFDAAAEAAELASGGEPEESRIRLAMIALLEGKNEDALRLLDFAWSEPYRSASVFFRAWAELKLKGRVAASSAGAAEDATVRKYLTLLSNIVKSPE